MTASEELWVEKYRPDTIEDMVLDPTLKTYFGDFVKSGSLPNMVLMGPPGIGKTTICRALANQCGCETLFIPCAVEGRVDTIQTKIKPFCESMGFGGATKIVILDELDSASATQDNSFQKSLRNIIELTPDTRFWGTANYNKIIPAVVSRCPIIKLRFSGSDLLKRLVFIMKSEGVKYDMDVLKQFVNEVVKSLYPDVRAIVNLLQQMCSSGEFKFVPGLNPVETTGTENDFVKEVVDMAMDASVPNLKLRKFYLDNKEKIQDYQQFATRIFNYCILNDIIKKRSTLLKMSELIWRMETVADVELQFFTFLLSMSV